MIVPRALCARVPHMQRSEMSLDRCLSRTRSWRAQETQPGAHKEGEGGGQRPWVLVLSSLRVCNLGGFGSLCAYGERISHWPLVVTARRVGTVGAARKLAVLFTHLLRPFHCPTALLYSARAIATSSVYAYACRVIRCMARRSMIIIMMYSRNVPSHVGTYISIYVPSYPEARGSNGGCG